MTPFTPIIIDGPARGKRITMESNTFIVTKAPKFNPNTYLNPNISDPLDMNIAGYEQVTYHIHRFQVGGMEFAIASTKLKPPTTEKALKLIFRPAAMGAMTKCQP